MTQVRCRAIVDVVREAVPPFVGLTEYRVEAWGYEPHDFVRVILLMRKVILLQLKRESGASLRKWNLYQIQRLNYAHSARIIT